MPKALLPFFKTLILKTFDYLESFNTSFSLLNVKKLNNKGTWG